MKKYLFIFKTEIINNLQYITDILFGFIGYFIVLFVFLNLWKYIYSDQSALINGYNMNQMIWYVIITEILWSILGGRIYSKKIANDVKGGNIAYNMTKPYNYILYSLFTHLGTCLVRAIMYILLGTFIGYIFLGSFPSLTLAKIFAVILTCILATIISTLLITSIGLISFFIEDSSPIYWIYSKTILMLGTMFPIEFFPKTMQLILTYSPIYVVSYGPAKLFVDFSLNNFANILIAQLIYILITYSLCALIYKKGVKKLNVNGG